MAVYDFPGSFDDFKDTKDYWIDHQIVENADFRNFLQDIDPYLGSSSPCHATALSFVRTHNSNNGELIYEEGEELKIRSQQSFEVSYTIQQVFNNLQKSQDKLKKECSISIFGYKIFYLVRGLFSW